MILLTVVFSSVIYTCVTDACPAVCTCTGINVDCSSKGLTSVPNGIPAETRNLTLVSNQISRIENEDFKGLTALQYLFLDNNQLSKLDDNTFVLLPNLKTLFLSSNQITRIDKQTFSGLSNLQSLYLDSNRINGIDDESFTSNGMIYIQYLNLNNNDLRSINNRTFVGLRTNMKSLSIEGNPFHCDCVLAGFVSFMTQFVSQSNAKCATPEELKGRYVKDLTPMECPNPQTGNTLKTTGATRDVRTKDKHTSLSSSWTTDREFTFTSTQSSKPRNTTFFVFSTTEIGTSRFTSVITKEPENASDCSLNETVFLVSLVVNGLLFPLLVILLCVIAKIVRNKRNQSSRYVNFERVCGDSSYGGYTQPKVVVGDGYLEPKHHSSEIRCHSTETSGHSDETRGHSSETRGHSNDARETAFARNTVSVLSSNSYAEIVE